VGKVVFLIIPVYNRREYTRGCLESLRRQQCGDFKVVVVDDSSKDGTGEMIQQEFSDTIVLKGDGNFFWTRSMNLGVQYALDHGADYILTLNDDTVAPPDFVGGLLDAAGKHPKTLIGASAVDIGTGCRIYGGERMDWFRARTVKLLNILPSAEQRGLQEVTHFPGRGLLIPASVFKEIGLYDQKHFPHGLADEDFTLRAARSGYRIYCNYDVKLLCIPGESYGVKLMKNRSWRNYRQHLFHLKGGGNLKFFARYVCRNCPRKYLPACLLMGFLRRILGYWKPHQVKVECL
jgi:GT2 family glycosyltransferase